MRKILGILICTLLFITSLAGIFSNVKAEIKYDSKKMKSNNFFDEYDKFLTLEEQELETSSLILNVNEIASSKVFTPVSKVELLGGYSVSSCDDTVSNPCIERGGGYYCLASEYTHNGYTTIMIGRKTVNGNYWEEWHTTLDPFQTIPDIDYWGSNMKFYVTALHSYQKYFFYIEIPDISDNSTWSANVLDWSNSEHNFEFFDSTSVGCYDGHNTVYAVIGDTDYPGSECDHSPMLLYKVGDQWSIKWFPDFEYCSHISIDIDQNTGFLYLAFERDNDIYLLVNDYNDGLDGDWSYWHVDESFDMKHPDVSAGHGFVYVSAQAKCGGNWDSWFFYSNDNNLLYQGWLIDTNEDEMYPRVSLTYDGNHVIGNWVYAKNNALYSGPSDKVSGTSSIAENYRCSDVATGHAAWTTINKDAIQTGDIIIGGYSPHSYIDSIHPNPSDKGKEVTFEGHGWDPDGWITGYEWESDIDGVLSNEKDFTSSDLSAGTHTIYFKVKDNNNLWSEYTSATLEIRGNNPPTADANGPYTGIFGEETEFDGKGSHDNDENGESIEQYDWKFYSSDDWHNNIGPTPTHVYNEPGEYTATLRVHDDEDFTDEDTADVTITNHFSSPAGSPMGLAWDGQYLWNADANDHKIFKIDPSNGDIIDNFISPGLSPRGLTWDGQYLWNADANDDKIYRIDQSDQGSVKDKIPSKELPWGLTWDGNSLWNVDTFTNKIYKINPSDGSIKKTLNLIDPIGDPTGLAFGSGHLWLADNDNNKIYKLNPSNGIVEGYIETPGTNPNGLTWNGQTLWNSDSWHDNIYKINIADLTINHAPSPNIDGQSSGNYKNDPFSFKFSASDSENHKVHLKIDWGHGNPTGWKGPYNSGEVKTFEHTYPDPDKPGRHWSKTYTIKAKAKDEFGKESDWCTHSFTLQKSKTKDINLFTRIFQQIVDKFPLLNKIFETAFENHFISNFLYILY